MAREWFYLLIAGAFEIIWAISLKYSEGFTKVVPSAITVVTVVCSFVFLSKALQSLPVGTAYTVWTGIGVMGTCLLGIILLGEPRSLIRLMFIFLILVGIIGLKFSEKM